MDNTTMCQPTGVFSNMITGAIQAMFLYQCGLVNLDRWPADRTDTLLREGFMDYDFIIIGAGSAGSVVANRLSENSAWKILLVEAGFDPPAESDIPALSVTMMDTEVDWRYQTEEEKFSCLGARDRKCFIPRGKVLGGSSSINTMLYVRGNKKDYDDWAAAGNTGWDYKSVLKYFKKSENIDDPGVKRRRNYYKYHGEGGPLNVARFNHTHYMHDTLMRAASHVGHKIVYDINGEEQIGFTAHFGTVGDGSRVSTANAFLQPIKSRTNLHIIKGAMATKIIIEKDPLRATGIEIKFKNGDKHIVKAKKEVISSAGSVNSPQLLMLSGIGPKKHLTELGIETLVDLAVGENLQDHPGTLIQYSFPKENITQPSLPFTIAEYIETKKGVLTGGIDTGAFLDTTRKGNPQPDIQLELVFIEELDPVTGLHVKARLNDELIKNYEKLVSEVNLMLFVIVLMRPKSRGYLTLRSTDPFDKPIINGNFLSVDEDRATLMKGINEVLRLERTPAFVKNQVKLTRVEYAACDVHKFTSRKYWDCIISHMTIPVYHVVGTVKMGPSKDKKAVVDPTLKVYGVQNLRVIDSSIIPNITCGNTNAPSIMIGEKGADMVREYWIKQ